MDDRSRIEASNVPRVGYLAVATGILGLALAVLWEGFRTPSGIVFVATAFGAGMWRVLDRRVRLEMSADGIRYRDWGLGTFSWMEFQGFRLTTWRGNLVVQLVPRDADAVLSRFSRYGRLNQRIGRLGGFPTFGIHVAPLTVTPRQAVAVTGHYLSRLD